METYLAQFLSMILISILIHEISRGETLFQD